MTSFEQAKPFSKDVTSTRLSLISRGKAETTLPVSVNSPSQLTSPRFTRSCTACSSLFLS